MGICNSCIYRGGTYVGGCKRRHINDYQCTNPSNCEVDFVTGEIINGSCRDHNRYGECLHFDDGSVPYFAWKKEEDIVYTLSATPFEEESYFINPPEESGQIESVCMLYAWKNKEDVIYTISDNPDMGDKIYSLTGPTELTVDYSEEGKITVEEITYKRDESSDVTNAFIIIDSENYYRDENYDTRIIEEREDGSD